jgi:hypothetical protein
MLGGDPERTLYSHVAIVTVAHERPRVGVGTLQLGRGGVQRDDALST